MGCACKRAIVDVRGIILRVGYNIDRALARFIYTCQILLLGDRASARRRELPEVVICILGSGGHPFSAATS